MESSPLYGDDHQWQVGKTLVQCLSHMLENEIGGGDVTFKITSQRSPDGAPIRISAHKLLLSARSPVFEAMFSGAYKESTQDVEICDIEHDSFKEMLRYIYCDVATLTGANVLNILYAAKKYILQGLIEKCKKYLEDEIATENVCHILNQSMVYDETELIENCLSFIGPKTHEVIKTNGFFDITDEALLKFLQYDRLCLGVEIELFQACIVWAKRKSDNPDDERIRGLLGECLHHIRFISMTPEEFAETVSTTDILTTEEKSLFFCVLLTSNSKQADKLREIGFNLTSRVVRCERYTSNSSSSYSIPCSGKPETISFSVDQPIDFLGCNVYLGPTGSKHEVKLSLEDESSREKIFETTETVTSDGSKQGTSVYVEKSYAVKANTKYKFTGIVLNGPNIGYGETNRSPVKVHGITVEVKALSWPYQETYYSSTTKGHFPGLLLKKSA